MLETLFYLPFLVSFFAVHSISIRINRNFSYPSVEDFNVYWNVPTFLCQKYGVDFENLIQKWGIFTNNKDSFRGDNISILYDPGDFPVVMKNLKSGNMFDRNGGIPQLGNITVHLEAFRKAIEEAVPSTFNGVGIIDFETWRPIFRQNWNEQAIYKKLSVDLERQYNPHKQEKELNKKAKTHFESASRVFMEETLKLAKILRPNGTWGYYGFPYCYNYRVSHSPYCPKIAMEENDRTIWLFNESTALYPSVYMSKKLNTTEQEYFVIGRLNEAWRMAVREPRQEISLVYPYVWFKYYDSEDYLTPEDIYTAFSITRKYKMGGLIIWGASKNVNSKENCLSLFRYLETTLGPALVEARKEHMHDEEPETDYEAETETETGFEPEPEPEPGIDTEIEPEPEPETATQPVFGFDAQFEPELEIATEAVPEPEPVVEFIHIPLEPSNELNVFNGANDVILDAISYNSIEKKSIPAEPTLSPALQNYYAWYNLFKTFF